MRKFLYVTILASALALTSCDVLWDTGYDDGDYSVGVSTDGTYYNPLYWGGGWYPGSGYYPNYYPNYYPGPTRPGVIRPGWGIANGPVGNVRPPMRPGAGSGTVPRPSVPSLPSGGNVRPGSNGTLMNPVPNLGGNPGPAILPQEVEGATGHGRH